MFHLEIHRRGKNTDPDVELHLKLISISPDKRILTVIRSQDPLAGPVNLPDSEIDYADELIPGNENVFYVPLGLALRFGLYTLSRVGDDDDL
jgi:hypothetical protein